MSELIYQSIHTGAAIDAAVTKVPTLETLINDLDAFNTNARFKIGSITRDMALSGNQAIAGLGFKPKAIIFIAAKQADVGIFSIGFQSDSEVTDAQVVYDRYSVAANNWGTNVNSAIQIYQGSSANYLTAKVATFDTDGFTLLWTPTGTLSGSLTAKYIAFK
jgi:hypothetical protein